MKASLVMSKIDLGSAVKASLVMPKIDLGSAVKASLVMPKIDLGSAVKASLVMPKIDLGSAVKASLVMSKLDPGSAVKASHASELSVAPHRQFAQPVLARAASWGVAPDLLPIEMAGQTLAEDVGDLGLVNGRQSSMELYRVLATIDNRVVDLLAGAWMLTSAPNPAGGSMAAHALIEAVDRTLRALAPEDDLLAWLETTGLRASVEYCANGQRPTRRARVEFAFASNSTEGAEAKAYVLALLRPTVSLLQARKHSGSPSSTTIAFLAAAVEAFLRGLISCLD